MDSDYLLEQVLENLRTILQKVDEIDICVANNMTAEIHLKTVEIRNNADDIKEIFKQLQNY